MIRRQIQVVLLIMLTGGLFAVALAAPKEVTHPVSIGDMQFSPASIEIKEGDTVAWTNNDVRDHTVKGSGFASGNLRSGETFKHTFAKAGKYPYRCELHPRMKGTVVVAEE
jgi:plastocyanin